MKLIISNKFNITEGRLVTFGIIGMVAAFGILIVFVSGGAIRPVPIFLKEKIETTVAFRNANGNLKVAGIKGNSGINPTLLTRTGGTAYILTVINQDTNLHMFYIDGLNLHTKILKHGENDTITIYPKNEGAYN
ncbi:MAG: hypothetical protein WBZ20_02970 [Nitrososphaeraceae archaeon]